MSTPTISKAIIDSLKSGCREFTKAVNAEVKASEHTDAMTDKILVPAIECASLESWDVHRAELDRIARTATKAVRSNLGYMQEEREDKGGNKTLVTVPTQQLANVFSVIRQTYARGLEFTDAKEVRFSFDRLKKNKAAAIEAENKKAKGRKGDMIALREVFATIKNRAKNLDDKELHNLVNRLKAEAKALPTSKSKAA